MPLSLILAALAALVAASPQQSADPAWRRPPPALEALALAAPVPTVDYAPNGRFALIVEREGPPPLARLARPMERLAGLRIDPATHARFTTDRPTKLTVRSLVADIDPPLELALTFPADQRVTDWVWSLNGRQLALVVESTETASTTLQVLAPEASGAALTLATDRLHPLFVRPRWTPEGDALLVALVPRDAGPLPERAALPAGPTALETAGARSPLRTYQDLLGDAADAARFAALARSELALVPASGGEAMRFEGLGPDLWVSASLAPGGLRVLATRLAEPFSLRQPWSAFARVIEVHDWSAGAHRVRELVALPVAADVPIGGVPTGPRDVQWIPGRTSSLTWVEALDGGDPRRAATYRDRWLRLDLDRELSGAPTTLAEVAERAAGILFTDDPDRFILTEVDRARRWRRATLVDGAGRYSPVVLEDRSQSDAYADPGAFVTRLDERGQTILQRDGVWAYRAGDGATPEGDRPFLARLNLESGEQRDLWRSGAGEYARVVAFLAGDTSGAVLVAVRRETPNDPPRDSLLPVPLPGAERSDLASRDILVAVDPQPALRAVKKELVRYPRGDGVELSATLYLPPGYDGAAPLPLLIWAYPREFTDAGLAGQVRGSAQRFTLAAGASHLSLALAGFAVLDGATMPILGDPETVNDTFVQQLVASAAAAIDYCVERGVAERGRVAVGGHSYGAFMTANLLAHSDLFAAGIAESGAYNRTLTPFGFQSERRALWSAREAYFALSPFLHAEGIQEPLLLLHGDADSNSGTFPEQSKRLFAALQGLGGTARLVMLPYEDHGYRSREAVLQVVAERYDWLLAHIGQR
ncbi:MAG: prolyl oligopeptidase family serine peptidase [Planctomycetota bacterium]